jgi:hypothetical protein
LQEGSNAFKHQQRVLEIEADLEVLQLSDEHVSQWVNVG